MNVTCEKCSTDYDLEEARVGESGLTVKCTHCGHIFRVEGEDEDPFSDGPLGSMELETPKLGMWRVRRRGGEELSFDDFATLRLWITERRVSRDDEISKTGDSWKPIGSIIELASLFDDAVPPIETPDDSGEAPPPPINREDLLDVSDVRLAGLDAKSDIIASGMFDPLDIEPPRPSAPREEAGSVAPAIPDLPLDGEIRRPPPLPGRRKAASGGAPPVVQPPSRRSSLGDRPAPGDRLIADRPSMVGRMPERPSMGGRLPAPPRRPSGARVGGRDSVVGRPPPRASANRLPPHRDSVPNTRMDGAPPRRRESVVVAGRRQPPGRPPRSPGLPPHRDAPPGELNMGFESEAPPMYAGQTANNGAGRGFLMGVLTMLALAGVGYFIYDNYVAPDRGQPAPPPPVVADRGPDVGATLERAEAAYARDTEIALAESVQHYDDALRALGTPPSDPAQAGRAYVGRARVALARAEYALVDGDKTSSAAHLATADRALAVARTLGQDVTHLQLALADYHRINGETDLARNYIDQLRGNAAMTSQVALVEAALELHGGKPGDAADQLGVLPAETKRLPRAVYMHAAALKAAGRVAEARGVLEAMLAINPGHEPGRRLLDSLPVAGEPVDAGVKAPVEPPEKDPPKKDPPKKDPPKKDPPKSSKPTGSFDSLMDRGNALLERGKVKQARKLFLAAADKRGSSPEPWASLGWCELDQGRHQKAVTYFERALRKNPRYADAMYGQATAYDRGGMKTQAKQAYQAYLNVHPRGSKASIIKRKLARMP